MNYFTIAYSNGEKEAKATADAARLAIRRRYPDAVFFDAHGWQWHGEDIPLFTDRILAWASEGDCLADPGLHAVADIRRND